MSRPAQVVIHETQFPGAIRKELVDCLRRRDINPKFHYDRPAQARKWLALHEAISPARNEPDCLAAYQRGFEAAAGRLKKGPVHVIGLGCGGGQKDAGLIRTLVGQGRKVFYTPVDVSVPMVLVAREEAMRFLPASHCFPRVCDLAGLLDWPGFLLERVTPASLRLVTFFGMLPNFEPAAVVPHLASLLGPGGQLLLSANLAPGRDYVEGVRKIRPQYDNALTRDWLLTLLVDLGAEPGDGSFKFELQPDPAGSGLLRVAALFRFERRRNLQVDSESLAFSKGDTLRLFFSYRHTPRLVKTLLETNQLEVLGQWLFASKEEGVFLAKKAD